MLAETNTASLNFQDRKNGMYKRWEDNNGKDRDEFLWLLCTNRQSHELDQLLLTQIVVKDVMLELGRKMHDVRSKFGIRQLCLCSLNKELVMANGIKSQQKSEWDSSESDDDDENGFRKWNLRAHLSQACHNRLPSGFNLISSTQKKYPNVPHKWLCQGRLLVLTDPAHPDNSKIFQDQWKRGQPVVFNNVESRLKQDLWQPQRFQQDYGEDKADLINCINGTVVPNIKTKHFWNGFEKFEERLKDNSNAQMVLKMKDWPPGADFAVMLPEHMADLMQALPMSDYTHRNGKLNIVSRSVHLILYSDQIILAIYFITNNDFCQQFSSWKNQMFCAL